ncbi:sensor histidine kinase [Sphingobacterium lactis]|uniref:sensor histidine kinase n=1 Tax=Sphingobacterium lactis TaxID=797291 RepID=UPI003EC855B9
MRTFLTTIIYAILFSVVIYSCIAAVYLFQHGRLEMSFIQAPQSVAGFAYGIFLYLLGVAIGKSLGYFYPQLTPLKRILIYSAAVVVLVPVAIFLIHLSIHVLWLREPFSEFLRTESWMSYVPLTILSLSIGLVFHAFYYYKAYKNEQIAKQQQIAGKAIAQLESLKNQIDAHFLFNSLNVLIGLIEEDQKKAISYTRSLSTIYRYILEHKDQDTVLIQDEISFTKNYVALLKLRFEEAIQLDIANNPELEQGYTVPLALQLLLENCIQHNKASEEEPLQISIYFEDGHLVVQNNLQEKQHNHRSTKLGLANIRDRYRLVSEKEIEISKTNTHFTVKLPILSEWKR